MCLFQEGGAKSGAAGENHSGGLYDVVLIMTKLSASNLISWLISEITIEQKDQTHCNTDIISSLASSRCFYHYKSLILADNTLSVKDDTKSIKGQQIQILH